MTKSKNTTAIWCVGCNEEVRAELVHGDVVYPHREDLKDLPFWKCPKCGDTVGTHYKSADPLKPLGVIATRGMKILRRNIHSCIDPIWTNRIMTRTQVYKYISTRLGYQYHTGDIKTMAEAKRVLTIVEQLKEGIKRDGFKI